jgi:hypothetical protein
MSSFMFILWIEDYMCQTCRHLHDLINHTRHIWHEIILDLLVVCPNAHIRRSVDSLSTAGLKAHALDLLRVHNARMHRPGHDQDPVPEQPRVFKCPEGKSRQLSLDACLLPGLPYMVWVSSSTSVHLMNTSEGEVHTWKDADRATQSRSAEIELFESSRHGCIILVAISVRRSV